MMARRRPGATEPGRARHIPVLLSEVVASLQPLDGGTYIDATFGRAATRAPFSKPPIAMCWRSIATRAPSLALRR